MAFGVEFRREKYTFTFSEVALVLGLLLAACGGQAGESAAT